MYMRKVDLRIQFCLFVTQKTNCKTTHASNLDVLMTHKHDNHNIKLVSSVVWQSQVEIKFYSVVFFDVFEVL